MYYSVYIINCILNKAKIQHVIQIKFSMETNRSNYNQAQIHKFNLNKNLII